MNIERVTDWSAIVAGLAETLGDDSDRRLLKAQFQEGSATGYRIDGNTWVLLRPEPEFQELVIVAMKGRNLRKVLPMIASEARQGGFKSLRAHTSRPGLLRLVKQVLPDAEQREIVLGVAL